MSTLVRYGEFNPAVLDQQAAQADMIGGSAIMTLEVGDNVLRFIPPPVGKQTPLKITGMHFVDPMPGVQRKIVFACPKVELKQPCNTCAAAAEMVKSPRPTDRALADRIGANMRVYANVHDRRFPDIPARVLTFGKQILEQLKAIWRNQRTGGNFFDPGPSGFDTIIHRIGQGQNDTKYTTAPDRYPRPLADSDDAIQHIIDNQIDLDTLVVPVEPPELIQVWQQVLGHGFQVQVPASAPFGQAAGAASVYSPPGYGRQPGWGTGAALAPAPAPPSAQPRAGAAFVSQHRQPAGGAWGGAQPAQPQVITAPAAAVTYEAPARGGAVAYSDAAAGDDFDDDFGPVG